MTALVSGAASSRESDSTSAAALPVASLMVEVGEDIGPRLCQAAGQRIMYYGTQCVPWLRIRREGLSGTHIELRAHEPSTPGVDVVIEFNLQRMLRDGMEVFQSVDCVVLSGRVPTKYIERAVFVKMRGRRNRHNLFKDQVDLTNHQIENRTAIGSAFRAALSAHVKLPQHVPDARSRSPGGCRSRSRSSRNGHGYDHCDRRGSSNDVGRGGRSPAPPPTRSRSPALPPARGRSPALPRVRGRSPALSPRRGSRAPWRVTEPALVPTPPAAPPPVHLRRAVPKARPGSARLRPAPRRAAEPALVPKPPAVPPPVHLRRAASEARCYYWLHS